MSAAVACLATLVCACAPTQDAPKGDKPVTPRFVNVFNPIEGRAVVVSCVEDGATVKNGEVVCTLDPTALKDRLTDQEFAVRKAEVTYLDAKLTREVAEIAVTEYLEGIYKHELGTAKGGIALAASDLKRAEARLDWSNKMHQKGYISEGENIDDRLRVDRAKYTVEMSQTKLAVLETYTKDKTVLELRSAVERARSGELEKQAEWELKKIGTERLKRQIDDCKVVAPADGVVKYGRPFGAGAVLTDGALIFQLSPVPSSKPRAK